MSTLKEFFKPKNKQEILSLAVILIVVSGFIGFEGYAFYKIMQNPYGLNEWKTTTKMPAEDFLSMSNTEFYGNPADLSGLTVFELELDYLDNMNVTIEFKFQNCIFINAALMSGKRVQESNFFSFYPDETKILNLTDNTIQLNLRNMHYPSNYDILCIKVKNMAFGADPHPEIQLLHKVTLIG